VIEVVKVKEIPLTQLKWLRQAELKAIDCLSQESRLKSGKNKKIKN
jgi:hypothetical protein